MFKRLSFIGLAAWSVLVDATESFAFDDKRKGFILGGGIGMGLTSYTYTQNYTPVFYPEYSTSKSESKASLMTDFKIGYAPSDLVQIHWVSKVAWLNWEGDLTASGVAGPGVTYFIEPEAPSWFLTAGLGLSTWNKVVSSQDTPYDQTTWYGLGLTMGAGYEFVSHWSIEGSVTWGNPKTERYDVRESVNPLSLRVTINFHAY